MESMTSESTMAGQAAGDPRWFPYAFDPATEHVLLVRKDEEDYRAASFLDQRSLKPDAERITLSWEHLAGALPADAREDAHYIFHIGHVGSTLISRLLGEVETVLALREPLLLRTFAELIPAQRDSKIGPLRKLLSRTFRPQQRAMIKATSYASEIAPLLLPDESRALFLYATPRHYIESILAGDASRQELRTWAPSRKARLESRCGDLDLPRSEAVLAAEAWACEMTSLERSAALLPSDSLLWLDFDRFLVDPARHLGVIGNFFGLALGSEDAATICGGPLMRRYSKALEYEYSPQLRREVLAEAAQMYGTAIEDALQWLDAAGQRCPLIARAIARAS